MSPMTPGEPAACPDHAKEPIRHIAAPLVSPCPKRAPPSLGLPSHRVQNSKPAKNARAIHRCPNWVSVSRTQATPPELATGGPWPPIFAARARSQAAPERTASAKPVHRMVASLARYARALAELPIAAVRNAGSATKY